MKILAQQILEKNAVTEIHLDGLVIYARPALPSYQLTVIRNECQITLRGNELILSRVRHLSGEAFRLFVLDTQHYGCAVYIATLYVTSDEAQCLQAELGLTLQDGIGEPGELDDIRMIEQRRLLGIKNDV
ncbi:hypothetical protein I6H07_23175 (plasmid) [Hafnia alvei]|uniref:hypothetical protein n=1 Tax=Hafnia alvei TaxID=569 RepID=UPI000B646F9C|nr:hypothetical protein [Hafnia alvei]MBI0278630.1 hypothetical protein [Hafnia alvei]PNL03923.1 hypothetical protein CEQ28_000580 [Hafnia alvei]